MSPISATGVMAVSRPMPGRAISAWTRGVGLARVAIWCSTRSIADGADVVLGFDGSFSGDGTALVAVTADKRLHVELVALWEPAGGQVPVVNVAAAIRAACRRWRVLEVAADPFRWARSLQLLDGEGLPVGEYPQSPARMQPATARFYEAVINGTLTHSGDSRLARHVGNAVYGKTPAAPGWPRNPATRRAALTPPWPP